MSVIDRRSFLLESATAVAGFTLLGACSSTRTAAEGASSAPAAAADAASAVPAAKPADWNPVAYNIARGKGGAIPEKYMADILGPDGENKHLGKHLPFVPALPDDRKIAGTVALMWGDPAKGHAKHPNAAPSETNPEGHWYNWIRVAVDGKPETEVESKFEGWPLSTGTGKYAGLAGADPAEDAGKNTVYLAVLPEGAKAGDTLRVWAHCLTHGEYVDFVTLA
jgi:hypothetical protein